MDLDVEQRAPRLGAGTAPPPRPRRWPWAWWLPLALAYAAVGAWLALRAGVVMGDALARVANANYAVASRDPHLSAIGFVWNPLPSLLTIPLVALRPLWGALVTHGLAGVVLSAGFMAAAVVELHRTALDLGVRRAVAVAVAVAFALHPMVVFYAGNGMSEAMFLFFLLLTTRQLVRWLVTGEVGALVGTAMGLAGAYLTRYEAAVAAVAVVGLVVVATTWRVPASWWARARLALADVAVVATPFVAVFLLWAAAGWLIVGSAFEQFTSSYGNTSTVATSVGDEAAGSPLGLIARQVLALEPLLPVVVAAGLGWAAWRRDPRVLAPLAVFGSVAAFSAYAMWSGATFGFLRFHLVVVPMASVLVLVALAPAPGQPRVARAGGHAARTAGPVVAALACGALALALPTTALAFRDAEVAPQELQVAAALDASLRDRHPGLVGQFATERQVAAYLDRLDLPEGSVLVDVLLGFPVVLGSERPEAFVIPADRDWPDLLADPQTHGVRYLLTVPPAGRGASDAINVAHPGIYDNGAGIAVLAGEFTNLTPTDPPWRLYRVLDAP